MTGSVAFILAAMLIAIGIGAPDGSQSLSPLAASPTISSRFMAIDIFVDPHGKPLAAYQVQVVADRSDVTLVGVEGGEHAAFSAAPYYDRRAILNQRIMIAAFNTTSNLPTNKTRIATMMIQVTGPGTPKFSPTLQVAASSDAKPIAADVSLSIATDAEGAKR